MDVGHHGSADSDPLPPVRYIRSRITNACDGCKARKVKCDGRLPCGFCAARQRAQMCHYSPQRRRRHSQRQSQPPSLSQSQSQSLPQSQSHEKLPRSPPLSARESRDRSVRSPSPTQTPGSRAVSSSVAVSSASASAAPSAAALSPRMASERHGSAGNQPRDASVAEDETEVPREARLLCDAHGKLTFIGDCAPLSFFQSVRRLVTNRVGQNAFAPHTSRFSVLENAPARQSKRSPRGADMPEVRPVHVAAAVSAYLATTAGLVDLFDSERLLDDLMLWANLARKPDNVTTIVHFLVLAIGLQADDEVLAHQYFEYARDMAYTYLSDSLGVETVQAFILVTIYMLCSCQINGAFLFFGIAARAAYSIGLHRTEVNARFGHEIHQQRDRLWKSLRVLDLFLSSSMGRPPSTSDLDCTVPYRAIGSDGNEVLNLLNASVQILLILECIIMEIYSRKKVSMQLTEGISLKLRDWSARWLSQLKDVIAQPALRNEAQVTGACQVLSSYYYAVMLVSRPFLMYEVCQRLGGGSAPSNRPALASGRSKLADACIDAASLMVDPVLDLVERGVLKGKAPLLVSWLFAASLVLGVGLLGGFGRILEKYTQLSIQTMEHFAQNDAHAKQYSLIAQSLLTTALEHLERQDLQERMRRTESSSQLFGLGAPDARSPMNKSPAAFRDVDLRVSTPVTTMARYRGSLDRPSFLQHEGLSSGGPSPRMAEMDSVFLGLSEPMLHTPDTNAYWDGIVGNNDNDPNSALNLFPLLEAGGGIDLAHWL
ncbi:fungal-specific transcription factor domain-containing protein [Trichoderma longibrachiatum]|uniref:Fungal-specific transcription factor domain-containing protein n=1 Tax=Trichoderma longibrachiatum ATCC 18648 TaxID=983965 RepID=A0A2T4BP83_TRILO|nr:fungal-specific transcription factor domain-containing protein [Trichoderma longibrachiatum ATCC 18648]